MKLVKLSASVGIKMRLLILSFFISLPTFALDFQVGKIPSDLKVVKSEEKHLEKLTVLQNGKPIYDYKANLVTEKVIKFGLVQFKDKSSPHLVTIWTAGAHGQELVVLDLAKKDKDQEKAIAYLYGSAWTIDLDINTERIEIKGKKELKDGQDEPEDEILTFKP